MLVESDSVRQQRERAWRVFAGIALVTGLVVVSFAAGMGVMWVLGPQVREAVASAESKPGANTTDLSREDQVALLRQVWGILDQEYVDPEALDQEEMGYGAVSGLVSAIGDPHTSFVEPEPAAILNEDMQGSFEGIGATVNMIDGKVVVVRPLPNSPAVQAGLREGDTILEVDDVSLEGKTLIEAITLIRGPKGTSVKLLVQREGVTEPFTVEVTRDKVELLTVESRMLDDNIAYLSLSEFNAVSEQKVHEALQGLLKNNPRGLVFDLRGNPGGYLQMSVEIAGEFLPRDALVLTDRERDKPEKEFRVRGDGLATEIPLVVLVNGNSASASEIVAGAIRDHKRGVLIGEKTYGKGSVQNTHALDDGSSLRVTIAKWYLPNGDNLDGNGITPDIEVPLTADDIAAGRDPQLERAVAYLLNGA